MHQNPRHCEILVSPAGLRLREPWRHLLAAFLTVSLTLSFAAFAQLSDRALGNEPTQVFLVGDSTMADKPVEDNPERGWGQALTQLFDSGVVIRNFAVNGRSSKSFIDEGRWDNVLRELRSGNWVFIQFGHNDSKSEDPIRFAAPQTTYRLNLTRFVTDTRQKGANPVLLTPVMRRRFDKEGRFFDTHSEYPAVVRDVARSMNVPLIDLHQKSRELIERYGPEGSKMLFLWIQPGHYNSIPDGKQDDTHFSEYGAARIASLVAVGVRELNLQLARNLRRSDFKDKYLYELPAACPPHFRKDTFSITRFGAVNDGVTSNTGPINAAIEACNKAGGGTVIVPRGLWLTGPIVMRSNVNLRLDKGAVATFSGNLDDYPLVETYYEGVEAYRSQPLISANRAENVAITGEGIFDGSGDRWRPVKRAKVTEAEWKQLTQRGGVVDRDNATWYPSVRALQGSINNDNGRRVPQKGRQYYESIKDFLRPNMLQFIGSKHLLIEGVTFENSPAWTLHFLLSEHITLRDVKVKNPWYGQNTDGVDLDSSRNVLVEGCVFDTGDDGICLKSGRDEEGRKRGVPTEKVLVRNCTVYRAHGGFVIGSEMSGGVKDVFISNSRFIGTDLGLRFKTTRGRGGVVERVYASNIDMMDIAGAAVFFDMYYAARDPIPRPGEKAVAPRTESLPVTEGTPQFRTFRISNIVCRGARQAVFISGLPEMGVKDIQIEDSTIQSQEGVYCEEAQQILFRNISVYSAESGPVITVKNSEGVSVDKMRFRKDADLMMLLSGEKTGKITVSNTDVSLSRKSFAYADGASEQAVQVAR